MLESIKDILLVFGRIITILPLLLVVTLFMGKRAIGELPIFDFLIILTLGAVVGADIADPNIDHLPTAAAVIALGILQKVVAKWKISNRKIGRLLTFEPTVIIQNGKFLNKNMKKIRYSIDNILQMLREKSIFDISEVETAIIEANGSLSVLKIPQKNSVTLEDMKMAKTTSAISFPLIVEGTIYSSVLKDFNLNEAWLQHQLSEKGIVDIRDVFFASMNRELELHVSLKDEKNVNVPVIKH
ncbi:DUF421 domain-containing protein [Jeotgalibacillus salarius]|uniref:DUF421 domain-containing protein n=1 Tax=Jeotgalibacillus salarius TaxID=546023 RepID=A0A4Y8LGM4_9BACL|nr:DUF421 domain-containing protein [Jeotgalibacillus salarius]TFE01493.1 DUF421 domain-containing protein [Jeotgalibacillus salarius]